MLLIIVIDLAMSSHDLICLQMEELNEVEKIIVGPFHPTIHIEHKFYRYEGASICLSLEALLGR